MSDLNGNGAMDVLLGKGDGTFATPLSSAVRWCSIGNGRGRLQRRRPSRPCRSCPEPDHPPRQRRRHIPTNGASYAAGVYPFAVAVGDFNGDGIPDLAVADAGPDTADANNQSTINIFLGNGDGTLPGGRHLRGRQRCPTPSRSRTSTATARMISSPPTMPITRPPNCSTLGGVVESDVRVFLGNGDGTFQPAEVTVPTLLAPSR